MRIVATSDTHFPFLAKNIPDGDVFIHAGDLMYRGNEAEWQPRLDSLSRLPHKTKIFVPGNHDFFIQHFPGPCMQDLRSAGVYVLGLNQDHLTTTLPNGMTVAGFPWVTDLPNWAFNRKEDEIRKLIEDVPATDIVISHSPPMDILDGGTHWGVSAFAERAASFLKAPKIWIMGHIHEKYGVLRTDRTAFYNVCMCDRNYKQNQEPMVIDV